MYLPNEVWWNKFYCQNQERHLILEEKVINHIHMIKQIQAYSKLYDFLMSINIYNVAIFHLVSP